MPLQESTLIYNNFKRMTIKPIIARYWIIAAKSEFVKASDWRSWADKVILSTEKPPIWIISMSLALNLEDLHKALEDILYTLKGAGLDATDDAVIGYLWLRFERHEFDLAECLNLIGRYADAYNASIECEVAYAFLNELEAKKKSALIIKKEAAQRFSPMRLLARQQWDEIQLTVSKLDSTRQP